MFIAAWLAVEGLPFGGLLDLGDSFSLLDCVSAASSTFCDLIAVVDMLIAMLLDASRGIVGAPLLFMMFVDSWILQ